MLVTKNLLIMRDGIRKQSSLNLQLHAGQTLIIQGPNGSGKSSLLKTLAGLLSPETGEILLNRPVIYLGHALNLNLELDVLANLELWSYLDQCAAGSALNSDDVSDDSAVSCVSSVVRANSKQMLINALSYWDLDIVANSLVKHLSAGQKQKLALARLWLLSQCYHQQCQQKQQYQQEQQGQHAPCLILLDEPTVHLDPAAIPKLLKLYQMNLQAGSAGVIVSHNAAFIADLKQLSTLNQQYSCNVLQLSL